MYRKKFLPKLVIASLLVGGVNFVPATVNFNAENLQIISVAYAETDEEIAKQKFKEGGELYKAKDYKGAILKLNEAIELNENYAAAYVLRAGAYSGMGNKQQAIDDYNQAIKISTHAIETEPDNEKHWYIRGLANAFKKISLSDDDFSQSISDFTQAIKINPNFATAYMRRSTCYSFMKQKKKSEQDKKMADKLGYKKGIWYESDEW